MRIDAISVIPYVFAPYMGASILGKAADRGVFSFHAHDLREWTHDRHRTVDDAPFGGGQGMLMKPEPIFEAVESVKAMAEGGTVVFFSPHGEVFDQTLAQELAQEERLIFMCGRYEGMDERVYSLADRIISLGDYVLTGGELAALIVSDAVIRLLPGALGDEMSAQDESFSNGLLEYEQYTRPASFRGMDVPSVLLSGDHGAVDRWRRRNSLERTVFLRPDLITDADISPEERQYIENVLEAACMHGEESGEEVE
ncbi:MAG: tRNA (guanosine(37)-N1)-methyltransferase TrmD [Atopobiaceae bacterium]|nr:tRNA (guanosine(37)-N1)-methyltransferase TrmD [Atopobiaceae bacterium]